ncbi:hypothetical protein PFISCL1PPCAC_3372, partial [Pristionchus fissidentatus]
ITATMKSALIFALLFSCSVAFTNYSCNVQNDIVYEPGYPPRTLTPEENQKIAEYIKEWKGWGEQLTRSILGQGPNPVEPVFPCLCRKCTAQ